MSQSVFCIFLTLLFAGDAKIVSPKDHECARECQPNESKRCTYNFTVEWYRTLSKACYNCPINKTDCDRPHCIAADGKIRAVVTVNRQIPSPTIQVCEGDTLEVWVHNQMDGGEGISIHWHGMHMRGNPHMDGVTMLTQCPINPLNKFRYTFKATPSGTHWYHSHAGMQREDGLFGALIVKQPRQFDTHATLYDHDLSDHVMILTDWNGQPAVQKLMDVLHGNSADPPQELSALLNGKHRNYNRTTKLGTASTPLELFHVKQGGRYRFRLIHAGSKRCVYKVSVDSHNLTIIALDGSNIKPVEVDTFAIYVGERYDFILHAKQSVGNYWLRTEGFIDCAARAAHVHAIVRYIGASEEDPIEPWYVPRLGKYLNPILFDKDKLKAGSQHGKGHDISIMDLESANDADLTNKKADITFYTGIDFYWSDNIRFHHPQYYPARKMETVYRLLTPNNDNISYEHSPVPLLSQPEDVKPEWLCNKSTVNMDKCYLDGCRCTHVVNIRYGQVVDVVTVYEGSSVATGGHPMHLHGQNFILLAHGKVGETTTVAKVKEMYEAGNISLRLVNPVIKDTIDIPDGGYAIFRFTSDNAGYWFYHCHVESHLIRGNGLVFKVGDRSQMAPNPPNFPRCGDWGYEGAPKFGNNEDCAIRKPCRTSSGDTLHKECKMICILLFLCTWLHWIGCVE